MNYIAVTIGPIYETLSKARKTRELWGGSYLFSYLMERILEPFAVGERRRDFIVPAIDETLFDNATPRPYGAFHDRAIFKSQEGDLEYLKNHIDEIFREIADSTPLDVDFIKNYFQVHTLELDVGEGKNPILELTPWLDSAELFHSVRQYDETKLKRFLQGDNRYLKKRAFAGKKSFPSLPEIALHDLLTATDVEDYFHRHLDEEESVYEAYKEKIKPYHKYIAIVHADGDSMGKVVESLKGQKEFETFSKALLNYAKSSADMVARYGGEMIYAGGDDLLFFAPVVSTGRTIFHLCDELGKNFDSLMQPLNDKLQNAKATLSFGVSVTYYKFPLYEALERSRTQLFGKAKGESKNNIAFEVTKHSGQVFGAVVPKGDETIFPDFLSLCAYDGGESEETGAFLHSLHHKLSLHANTIEKIATSETANERLKNFFENYFNEQEVHSQYRSFFEALTPLIEAAYKHYPPRPEIDNPNDQEAMKLIYGALRFKKFILGDRS